MNVKGYSGIEGNEKADETSRQTAADGSRLSKPEIEILAGIKQLQAFIIHSKLKNLGWGRQAIKRLTYPM